MKYKRLRLKWALRLLRAKYFVAMDQEASVIALDTVDPKRESHRMALEAQSTELTMFREAMDTFIQEHERIVSKLTRSNHAPRVKPTKQDERSRSPRTGKD